jgi:sialic acid synthase SpsE
MRCQIVAELATNHGGDVELASRMIRAAAEAGADWVKLQSYSLESINPADPQAEWLRQAHLDREDHEALMAVAKEAGIQFLSTTFDAPSLQMLRELGLKTFKIASSESGNSWWNPQAIAEQWIVSYPWGDAEKARPSGNTFHGISIPADDRRCQRLTAIPLYPTPLEAVGRAALLDGWSDHCVGIDACLWAIAQGVKVLEVHVTNGEGRVCPWDKTMAQVRQLRSFAESCETMKSGVAQTFRDRWKRA